MAQVSFEIKYYFDAKGQDWADIPTEQLDKILENCRSGISLNFDSKALSYFSNGPIISTTLLITLHSSS